MDNTDTKLRKQPSSNSVRITYIGHATLLLDFGQTCVLTDPNFDNKLGFFLPRVTPPGMRISELPHIDAILLTHAHADHLSFSSLRALPATIPIYAPPVVSQWLKRAGIASAHAVEPGQTILIGEVVVTIVAARHVGARYGLDRWRGAAHMYLIDDGGVSVLFTGDTALTPDAITLAGTILPRRVDVALLPIGFAPRWKEFMFRRGHLDSRRCTHAVRTAQCANVDSISLGNVSTCDLRRPRCNTHSARTPRELREKSRSKDHSAW